MWVHALEKVIHEKLGTLKYPEPDPLADLNIKTHTAEQSSSDDEYVDATSNFDSPTSLRKSMEHCASVQADLNSSVLNDEEPNFDDGHEDFDKIYEENYETDLETVQETGSVLPHLFSRMVLYFSPITN